MERTLLINQKTVTGKVLLDVPSRSERLTMIKEWGQVGPEEVIKISQELKKRIKEVNLEVDPVEYSGTDTEYEELQVVIINSFEALDNSPVADEVLNYLGSVLISGKLGNLSETQ